jgi:hypothetical protein
MKNPWLKKNPALSVALSVANAWAGSVRGLAAATMKRNAALATKPKPKPKKRVRKRRAF